MSANGRQETEGDHIVAQTGSARPDATRKAPAAADAAVGSPEYLHSVFAHAAMLADRAVGLWLARGSVQAGDQAPRPVRGDADEFGALRAMVRAAATAYVRRLRAEGTTPERMLVLVKSATIDHGSPGFGAQELTNDIVRWSIEAYFSE
jgi:hypothetical protein